MGFKGTVIPNPPFPRRSPKEVGDVIALSDITPSGAADNSQEPSPVGSRRGRLTPNLSRASSDADHVVSPGWGTEEDGECCQGEGQTGGGRMERGQPEGQRRGSWRGKGGDGQRDGVRNERERGRRAEDRKRL